MREWIEMIEVGRLEWPWDQNIISAWTAFSQHPVFPRASRPEKGNCLSASDAGIHGHVFDFIEKVVLTNILRNRNVAQQSTNYI